MNLFEESDVGRCFSIAGLFSVMLSCEIAIPAILTVYYSSHRPSEGLSSQHFNFDNSGPLCLNTENMAMDRVKTILSSDLMEMADEFQQTGALVMPTTSSIHSSMMPTDTVIILPTTFSCLLT